MLPAFDNRRSELRNKLAPIKWTTNWSLGRFTIRPHHQHGLQGVDTIVSFYIVLEQVDRISIMQMKHNASSGLHKTSFDVPYENFVGAVLDGRYRIERFVRAKGHAEYFILNSMEDESLKLHAESYDLKGICREVRQSRQRHIRRRAVTADERIYQNGKLFLIFSKTTCGIQKFPGVVARHSLESISKSDSSSTAISCAPCQPLGEGILLKLEAVVMTTNIVISGLLNNPSGVDGKISAISRLREDKLREARWDLHEALQTAGTLSNYDTSACYIMPEFRAWDAEDYSYRGILNTKVSTSSCCKLMEGNCGYCSAGLMGRAAIERRRENLWKDILVSLGLIQRCPIPYFSKIPSSFVLEPIQLTYAEALGQTSSHALVPKPVPKSARRTAKQRAKRQRRRAKEIQENTGD
ncbi:hypothetical protein VFPPC_10753 [Pochonia chlamydosporia 170]|uniref:Uncharacterized protein n=1 Tax=Pochonia chlamydosporia 170 TaxID=1380566 RepID=A0A179F4P6_METCM|nr:hypothetical protein VFPPC_10753 [Pochonia chlamydosporia 170]OAQ60340.1 hypothetical protein VFPPC_10753 [Pochonia chlamydosporia 170]